MITCPQFNDPKYKHLVSKLGELEAFKYWHQNGGDLSKVLTDKDKKDLIDQAIVIKDEINPSHFREMFDNDPEGFLSEMADQLTATASEAETAKKILGAELSNIALQLREARELKSQPGAKVSEANEEVTIDPADYNPTTQDSQAYEADQMRKADKEDPISRSILGGGGHSLSINPKMVKLVDELEPEQRELYINFVHDNLYGRNDNPVTTSLLNNAALMAHDLRRMDLVNMARLIYNYLNLNPTLTISIVDGKDSSVFLSDPKTKAYYSPGNNKIYFRKDYIGIASMEIETEAVLEELLHSLTVQPWVTYAKHLSPAEAQFKNIVDNYFNEWIVKEGALRQKSQQKRGELPVNYRFSDPREFLIGILLDNEFRNHLKNISDPNEPEGGFFNRLMKGIVEGILRLFGMGIEKKAIENIEFKNLESGMLKSLTDYLNNINKISMITGLKEQGRDYGLSFAVTAGQDYHSESQRIKDLFTPQMRKEIKDVVEKAILSIKSFSSSIRGKIPESQERFKVLFNQLKKLDNPEYNVDQIDFFLDFTTEIAALMNVAHDKMFKLYTDEKIIDPDFKLKEYESIISAVRNFDSIQNDIESVKLSLVRIGNKQTVEEIDNMRIKREQMDRMYSNGVFPLVTEKFVNIVEPASKRALEIAKENIETLNKRLELAKKSGNSARINLIKRKIGEEEENIRKNFSTTSKEIADWLRGNMGDSNLLSAYLEAAVSNKNPIVSGLAVYIRNMRNEASPKVLELQNDIQKYHDNYAKSTGRNKNDVASFNKPIIHTYDVITGSNPDGSPIKSKKAQLLNPFNGGHILELQRFSHEISELVFQRKKLEQTPGIHDEEIRELNNQIKVKSNDRRQFMRDYMEQPYKKEVHEALDLLYKDLGGYSAWDYMGPLLNDIDDLQDLIDKTYDEGYLATLYDMLDEKNFELRRLSSLYEKSTNSRELKVAEILKERTAKLKEFSNWKLEERGKNQFESEKSRIESYYKKGKITKLQYDRWYQENTVTELSPSYWETKNKILKDLNDILSQMGSSSSKNEELSSMYKEMEDIVKAHRDQQGIINGQEMSEKELKDVKAVEQKIEDIKDRIANVMGLTRLERIELSQLSSEVNDIDEKLLYASDEEDYQNLEDRRNGIEERIEEIRSKKKKIDKKLLSKYINLISQLSKLDSTTSTKYYQDELESRLDAEKSKVDIAKMGDKFSSEGVIYRKANNEWHRSNNKKTEKVETTVAEDVYRRTQADVNITASDWWKDNHITRWRWIKNDDWNSTDPESLSGEWKEVEDPIYAWRQTRPIEERFILQNQPALKYKTRKIKDEYVNNLYKESVTGDVNPKLIGAKDDRYINKEYFKLRDSNNSVDKATFQYLENLTSVYLAAQESIPKGKRPGYDLPSMRKDSVERFLAKSLTDHGEGLYKSIGQWLKGFNDNVAKNEQDKDILFGYNDDFSGMVPVKFLGDINIEDQSMDLARMILAFSAENAEREQLIKALPFATAVRDIVNSPEYKPVRTKGGLVQTVKRKFLGKGTELAVRKQTSNTAMQINELIKSEFYGETMKDMPGAKLIRGALGVGAKALLGFNFISSVQNYANAFTQSIMETESKVNGNFSRKNYLDAQKIYYANVTSLMSDVGKYGDKSYLTQFFDYFGGINFKLLNNGYDSLSHGRVRNFAESLAIPNQITEHALNYQLGIAIGKNYQVDGPKGKDSIINAFTLRDGRLVVKEGYTVSEEDRKTFTAKLNSSARRINGEYGDSIVIDKYALGRMALFMNRYVIPFIAKRYGARKLDIQDGIREEGYWRLLGKLFIQDIRALSIPIISGWKYYTPEEKSAVIRATTEFGFTVMFFLAISALGGDDDKKLRDNSLLENNILYALKGIQQQNETFMPIPGVGFDDIVRKIQNPFPIFGKVKNLASLINDATHTISYEMGLPGVQESDVYYTKNTGWHKAGDMKLTNDIEKLLTIPYRLHQYLNPDVAVKNLDMFQRIR